MNADDLFVRVDVENKFRYGGDSVLSLALHDVDLSGGHIEHFGELADLRTLLVHDRCAEKIGDKVPSLRQTHVAAGKVHDLVFQ